MNAIVTGGAGFIGSHLAERLLKEGHRVVVLDNLSTGRLTNLKAAKRRTRFAFIRCDVGDYNTIARHFKGIDTVFHLAALADIVPSVVEPLTYYSSNVDGTVSVLEASRRAGVKKFIYAGSSSCYGIPDVYPTQETAAIRPQYPYAFTKYIGELTCFHWSKVYKMPVVSLRLFNVYGPRSRTSGAYGAVLGVFLAQKLHNKPFTVVGDGQQKRDFVYVEDVAEAFVKAATVKKAEGTFNVGTGKPQSINRLVELLGGRKIHIPKRPGEPQCTWADVRKIKKVLGWRARTSFEEGVKKVLQQSRQWKNAPVWTPASIKKATRQWFEYLR